MTLRGVVWRIAGLLVVLALAGTPNARAQAISGGAGFAGADRGAHQKRVLVLYSAGPGPSFAAFDSALESDLTQRLGGQLDLYREYLDNGRFALTSEYLSTFRTYLRDKYRDRPDVVVAVALAAVGFVNQYSEDLFPRTPVLFVATTDSRPRYGTSVFSETDWNGSLKLALDLQPDTRQVFVVAGASEFDRRSLSGARQQFTDFEKRLDITYLSGLPIDDLERTVATLPQHSIIYYVNVTLDGAERRFEGTSALDRIAAIANAPIYIQSEANFARGAMGGHIWSSRPWGLRSSEIIVRLLSGEAPNAIPPSKVDIYSSQLDWRQMQRWNVDERMIPAGTRILFREPTFWENYKWRIIGVTLLCVIQTILIATLLVQRQRRSRAERHKDKADRALQQMAGRLLLFQDEEHRRVAAELHDGLGQSLAIIKNRVTICQRTISDPEQVKEQLEEIFATATSAIEEVREIAHNLRPYELDRIGLVGAIESMIERVGDSTSIQVSKDLAPIDGLLSQESETSLYRIVQEGLNNVVKHSAATTARVEIRRNGTELVITVQDDGSGISPSVAEHHGRDHKGFGLVGISERVRLIGGSHTIDSEPARGTRLTVRLELSRVAAR